MKPFIILNEFIIDYLKLPLASIKDKYNIIENNLLNKLFNIIDKFPNYYSIIKDKLNLEKINNNITPYSDYINKIILDYLEILDKDIISFINKLMHYTYIDGLYYQDSPCDDSYCFNESEILENFDDINFDFNINDNDARNLEQNTKKTIRKLEIPNLNNKKPKNKKFRNLEKYDSSMGNIDENDIYNYLLDMEIILNEFNNSYLSKDFKNMNLISKSFLDNINNTYLNKLKNSIEMIGAKFKTILAGENYIKFEDKLFEPYINISLYINNNS